LSPLCSRATFDTTRRYRYRLIHDWTGSPERVAFIMLNPSTADERTLDPTIRRCIGFAKAWGFGGIDVVNLFAWRTTDPAALARVADPIGPRNDGMIAAALRQSAVASRRGDARESHGIDPPPWNGWLWSWVFRSSASA
jgi:hypothetical protein